MKYKVGDKVRIKGVNNFYNGWIGVISKIDPDITNSWDFPYNISIEKIDNRWIPVREYEIELIEPVKIDEYEDWED